MIWTLHQTLSKLVSCPGVKKNDLAKTTKLSLDTKKSFHISILTWYNVRIPYLMRGPNWAPEAFRG